MKNEILDFLVECLHERRDAFERNLKEFNDYSEADVFTFHLKVKVAEGFLAGLRG